MALRSSARLCEAAEFRRVRQEGTPCFGRYMILNVLRRSESESSRIGIVTSRRLGGAVIRNRVRRRLREIVRSRFPGSAGPGLWVVLVAKRAAVDASFEELRGEWLRLGKRASILPAS